MLALRTGGTPFYTTSTLSFDFAGAASLAPLFHAKGAGLDATRFATTAKYRSPIQFGSSIQTMPCSLPPAHLCLRFGF